MDFQWQYNPLVIPLGISIILLLALIVLGLRHRHHPVALPYLYFMVGLLIWIVTSLIEISTLNLDVAMFAADLSFLGITFFPIAWLNVVMIYVGKNKAFRRVSPFLILFPILTNVIIWTNPLHHLWRGDSYRDLTTTWFPISYYEYGPWFLVHLIFSLSVTFTATYVLARSLFIREKAYRAQILSMLVALNLPLGVEILHRIGLQPIPHYNATTLVFPISALLTGWILFRHRFLDLMPIARDFVVESMDDLMLVLDDRKRLVDLNPSARQHLFRDHQGIIGTHLDDLLPDHSQRIAGIIENHYAHEEIEILRGDGCRTYEVSLSAIDNRARDHAGWLLLLRDITTRKQTEQAFYKQVQQVAILEERQRLARELHDSVNQTLFAARMLADLLPRAIDKKPEKVRDYACNIQQLIHEASAEIRLVLLELYPDALIETDLGTIIKHLCEAFKSPVGTQVDYSNNSQIHLEKDAQLAFYRIAQEALHNISKHTEATQVTVKLVERDDTIQLSVQDNGSGFDTTNTPPDHFGLTNMVERANSVGATLNIVSKIDDGTTITLARKMS